MKIEQGMWDYPFREFENWLIITSSNVHVILISLSLLTTTTYLHCSIKSVAEVARRKRIQLPGKCTWFHMYSLQLCAWSLFDYTPSIYYTVSMNDPER
jgi:hypothetical protein